MKKCFWLATIAAISFSCSHENGLTNTERVTFSIDMLNVDREEMADTRSDDI